MRGVQVHRRQRHPRLHAALQLQQLDLEVDGRARSGWSSLNCRSSMISRGSSARRALGLSTRRF